MVIEWLLVVAIFYSSAEARVDFIGETKFCGAWNTWDANASECRCSQAPTPMKVLECHENYTIIDYDACATYDEESQATLVGFCPFSTHGVFSGRLSSNISSLNLNLTSFMCDPLNRTGVLCGECKSGLGPALLNYSYPCLECTSYGWLHTLLPLSFLPLSSL